MARVLVVGGAGYVGGAMCAYLRDRGDFVWVLDDLSRGHRDRVLADGLTVARAGDRPVVEALLRRERFDAILHFAAFALVGESVEKPELYRENNVEQTRLLIETALDCGISRFIFSSTCAIYGDPGDRAIAEDLPKAPINPYGQTKLECERLLEEFARTRGLRAVALRYFNACGAEAGLRTGEDHEPETHLIPNVLAAALEKRPLSINGTDYPTPDGTCVRDYVHVTDLARAHALALDRLMGPAGVQGPGSFEAFNLGSGSGYSVREVIAAAEKAVGGSIEVKVGPRRPGDPPRLVADATRAARDLGWRPEFGLERILADAWAWQRKKAIPRRAVFLDRDGTLNVDPGYLRRVEDLEVLPGVAEALHELKRAGYSLVVVSNQSGVGRGIIDPTVLPRIHDALDALLRPKGAAIDDFELCIHHPEAGCNCRKPRPGLLTGAARRLNLDLSRSWMVGDKTVDIGAGTAAGVRGSVLVRTGDGRISEKELVPGAAAYVADGILEAARWIVAQG
jgi:UDP-glucose-4-epimerase GalE